MQIVHADVEKRGVLCNGTSIVSVFFNINDTANDTGFFDWQANATKGGDIYLDMGKIAPKQSAMFANIQGYYGTDSMPMCDLIKEADARGYSRHHLYVSLGKVLCAFPPKRDELLQVLNGETHRRTAVSRKLLTSPKTILFVNLVEPPSK